MPSPIAQWKQYLILLVVSLFLLGCIVFSSIGSIINIRKQIEVNNFLSKHNTAEKSAGRNRLWSWHIYHFLDLNH